MRPISRTTRRLAVAILLVATVPLLASLVVARLLVRSATGYLVRDEVGQELEGALGVYSELARAVKESMRARADVLATREPLRSAAARRARAELEGALGEALADYPDLVSVAVFEGPDGAALAARDRGRPVDEASERALSVRRPLSAAEGAPELEAVFAAPRARFDDLERAADFVRLYRALERERPHVERVYLGVYAALVFVTLLVSVAIAYALARDVTRRIQSLALATRAVGAGDLSVRVPVEGDDEISDLARSFNHMLGEVEEGRARVEFLRRVGAWQDMARRLAHEIKNPLTPIQLAVEECHRRYDGPEPGFRRLLDATLEIVAEEIGTLRRLVGEFSAFARLPRATLAPHDLAVVLRERAARLALGGEGGEAEGGARPDGPPVEWALPPGPAPVALDPDMFGRVLANILDNARQALDPPPPGGGRVRASLAVGEREVTLDVDDDGPGIDPALRARVFDPYVTTKAEGTGLGLAIAKKIVVEHGGTLEALASPLGGARFRIRLPRLGTPASDAAVGAAAAAEAGEAPAPGPAAA
ncbi:MAG TPA: ATP-binding protein [Polyangiaceae bacterium]|nr:ATP-binding protein [Polyangiaceae bacterium]